MLNVLYCQSTSSSNFCDVYYFQYCEFYPNYEKCKKWLEANLPDEFERLMSLKGEFIAQYTLKNIIEAPQFCVKFY